MSELLTCTHCNETKARSYFLPGHKPGGWCKACHNKDRRDKRAGLLPVRPVINCLNCGQNLAGMRRHAKYCSSACSAAHWRKNHPGYSRDSHLKFYYGLSSKDVEERLIKQSGKCAICGTSKPKGNGWHVDHCHNSKAIRGILCGPCNQGLGNFKDNITSLAAAIRYLSEFVEEQGSSDQLM